MKLDDLKIKPLKIKKEILILCALFLLAVILVGVEISGKNAALSKLEDANAKIETLTAQTAAAEAKATEAVRSAEDLTAQLTEAQAKVEELTGQLTEAQTRAENAAAEIANQTALRAQAEEALEAVQAQAAQELEALKASMTEEITRAVEEVRAEAAAARVVEVVSDTTADLKTEAYLMFADSDWDISYWNEEAAETAITAVKAEITGAGVYTVALDFTGTTGGAAHGVGFAALGLTNGETAFPGACIKINEIRVNGEAIEVKKGYTSSDDGVETRLTIYNEWVNALPIDARSFDGSVEDASPIIVDKAAFEAAQTVEIDFELILAE